MRIGVDWLFVVLLLAAAVSGYYLEALVLLGSLTAHELAHLTVAWVLGVEVEQLLLTPFGGMARMDSTLETDPQTETSVALAGPFQSFFLAGLTLFLAGHQLWDQHLVKFCFDINSSLAFFNLIPALPLDGGRAMRGLLAQRWGYRRVTTWMTWIGRYAGIFMAATALTVLVRGGRVYATPLVGGFFLSLYAGREGEAALYRSYRQFLHKRERMAERRVLAARQLVAVTGTHLGELMQHLGDRGYHLVLVVDEAMRPLGTLHEAELMDAFAEFGPEATVDEILDR
ncbi:MAG: M50 family metallopeptidase [Mycobacterium leprae]